MLWTCRTYMESSFILSLALQWNPKWPPYSSCSSGAPYMASASLCALTSAGAPLLPTSLSHPYPFSGLCLLRMAHYPFSLHRCIRGVCVCLLCGVSTGCSPGPTPAVIAVCPLLSCYLQVVQSSWELQKLSLYPEAKSSVTPLPLYRLSWGSCSISWQTRKSQHCFGGNIWSLLWPTNVSKLFLILFTLPLQYNVCKKRMKEVWPPKGRENQLGEAVDY